MSLRDKQRGDSLTSNASSGRSSNSLTRDEKTDKISSNNNNNSIDQNDNNIGLSPFSTPSTPARSLSSKVSSGYQSDVSGSLTSLNFSEWSSSYQQRQRSPYSKNILSDIKEKLLEEVKNVELELSIIEKEKTALLQVRLFVLNFRTLLDESERNNQGLLVVSRLKNIVDKTVSDIDVYDEAILHAAGIPLSQHLRNSLHDVKDIVNGLTRSLLKIENIEDVFSRCGRLFGIVDTILVRFYEQDIDSLLLDEDADVSDTVLANGVCKSTHSSHSDTQLCEKCLEQVDEVPDASSPLFELQQRTSVEFESGEASLVTDTTQEESNKVVEDHNKNILIATIKQVKKVLNQLKSVERMTSGRPKMKALLVKFQEVDKCFETKQLEGMDFYSSVLKNNVQKLRKVLGIQKPGQTELDDTRFLLGQLAGRASILSKLQGSEDKY